jgi:hypothetical protein
MNADLGTTALTGQRDDPFHLERGRIARPVQVEGSGERTLAQPTGWTLRGCCTIRSVVPHKVEDGQRIEIARMQQLLAERD